MGHRSSGGADVSIPPRVALAVVGRDDVAGM